MSTIIILDVQKIETAVSTLENTERVIEIGSDEHLDAIISIRNNLNWSSQSLRELVDSIEGIFNICTPEIADKVILKTFPCLELSKKIISDIRSCGLEEGLQSAMDEFQTEVSDLFEILNDLSAHKSSEADGDENYF